MKGNDLHLFVREPPIPLGRLLFRSVDLMASPRRISIAMEFVPFSTQVAQLGQLRWAWLTAAISNQRAEPRTFGKEVQWHTFVGCVSKATPSGLCTPFLSNPRPNRQSELNFQEPPAVIGQFRTY
jgi:hypothetical protein